ncbi:MAG: imidazole glycerol phosphate synthase subunit HisF [Candidatus Niyogibacteria bacterium RIFCSPLOWO2_01_FULL_45_48]|uniref:imidazole glycerol-phosphate synthase n=2 Tax=Candidatus Niyogiibacteriota TaxID=1817912 RepID=A0A1G2F0B2_9BACT|nr:MAG: imidazole glycerol phosphate synthase subunit HisF [Candidatus Niyogibacteria bacterium RIFCSPHIGHO2_01_FULL_45_28]OGZ31102.1 MAG: imidazole glycerol phosphate synthase subunit HisF [Candidatus Niyogibacteria bacterium RIFCSPLOWO2_01_FULL_45_48]OGZ31485.1 MAG: imidazole glycerol phosphate synthase subunit HisF [Candidatus Niyogibacteria bacterium RIFCSPLOWO2_02_FULL_45_13]
MAKNVRIIPLLHVKGPNVVKPVHTEALRIVGNPEELAGRYYEDGADEIIYLDIVASLYQRNFDFELLKSVSRDIFIPFTVGGGIRTIQDIRNALRVGADKVAINTHAVKNPDFLKEASKIFGSQCIVLFIEAKKVGAGKWEAYTDGGREKTGIDAVEWAKRGVDLGVGEILITSIDRDGTGAGYESELVSAVTSWAPIPVIAHGGAGNFQTVEGVILKDKADAVALSSSLHYKNFSTEELKRHLYSKKINVRL